MKFEELNLDERILRAVEDMGFEEASPIQASAIPVIMDDRDVVGQAQTGTGKTAAYSIPVLEKIDPDLKKLQAVILCPTRELAVQVAEEIRKLAKYMSEQSIAKISAVVFFEVLSLDAISFVLSVSLLFLSFFISFRSSRSRPRRGRYRKARLPIRTAP